MRKTSSLKIRAVLLLISLLLWPLSLTQQSGSPIPKPQIKYPIALATAKQTEATPDKPATSPAPVVANPETHPQYKYEALISPTGPLYTSIDPEPFLSRINATNGWNSVTNASSGPIIAVIDTGFALAHQDLSARWATGGYDFIHNDSSPQAGTSNPSGSAVFHGTMTAGLAGLLNPDSPILPLQALDDNGVGYTDQIAAAVRYAADHGARIISMSLGTDQDDAYLHQQIDYAISKGVLVVAAAGNNGCNCLSYPAAYPEVLSVGATDSTNTRASFSSYGANLDVIAPGTATDVCSAFYSASNTTSAYSCGYSGTSFATPIVGGLAALMLRHNPSLSEADLFRAIVQSTTKTTAMAGAGRTLTEGYGLVDVAKAIAAVSLAPAGGQITNKASLSISSPTLYSGPAMDTTCTGSVGASCQVKLIGPSGQIVDLGTKILNDYGADFTWNANTLGLTPGTWTVAATLTEWGQTPTATQKSFTVNP